ncbi:bifunctional diguanylate cyclase/phosphodiesterase [Parachitinimonas caeni]|uniref:EAL domain-containing protein n=1 Tax=Parachitinimonas caeni TaxID=3031301 RepID=A0ABT7DZ96_9NEIS|nr:EAL domain-containing protein [Parachitinimonas caeni]MDK2125391.1 EAL domain-containing protein [Parachitinimonas caeni]
MTTAEADRASHPSRATAWWTWLVPLLVFQLGSQVSLFLPLGLQSSALYLPTALGLVLVHWWGPRILPALYLSAAASSALWLGELHWHSLLHPLPEVLTVGLSWFLFHGLVHHPPRLSRQRDLHWFIAMGGALPITIGAIWAQFQLYLLGELLPEEAGWGILNGWVADLLAGLVISLPILYWLERRSNPWWGTLSRRGKLEMVLLCLGPLMLSRWLPVHPYWYAYAGFALLSALRHGIPAAMLMNGWIVLLTLALPVIASGARGILSEGVEIHEVYLSLIVMSLAAVWIGAAVGHLRQQVAELKRAQEALRDSENTAHKYRHLVSASSDLIALVDTHEHCVIANDTLKYYLGREGLAFSAENLVQLWGAEMANALKPAFLGALQGKGVTSKDWTTLNGQRCFLDVHVDPYRDDQGAVQGVVFSARDLSEEAHLLQLQQQTQEVAKVGGWEMDCRSDELSWTQECYRLHGIGSDFKLDLGSMLGLYSPVDSDQFAVVLESARQSGEEFDIEVTCARDQQLLRVTAKVERNGEGRVIRLFGSYQDITEQRRAEAQARLAATVFANSAESIVVADANRRIVTVNQAFTKITGFADTEVLGRDLHFLASDIQDQSFYSRIWLDIEQYGCWQGEVWNRRKNGDLYPEWQTLSMAYDEQGRVANYICVCSDVSAHKEAVAQVEHLANYDPLTELPNRALLLDRIGQAIVMAERNRKQIALMFIDLDRFKNINDSLGHSVGDQVLTQVADRLKWCLRSSDTICRYGGDEFVVLLPDVDEPADAALVAKKLVETVAWPFQVQGNELTITPSIGISIYPADGHDIDTLLKNADAAMYHAKASGRNNFQFYTQELNGRTYDYLMVENQLRRAIERKEFQLYYQPQIELASGALVGCEALIRWMHPERGMVPPDRFIPVAEDSGLIVRIGEWALIEACRQNKAWQEQGLPAIPVAVNLSPAQFSSSITATVEIALMETGLSARHLELEVTEGVVMRDAIEVIDTLRELKRMGVRLSIDDFGTGYSSLSYLRRFPIDKLKVDRSFVDEIGADVDDEAIASAIIDLAHSLRLKVIAEGVETADQARFLLQRGCDQIQGFLVSRPLSAGAMAEFLQTWRADTGQALLTSYHDVKP